MTIDEQVENKIRNIIREEITRYDRYILPLMVQVSNNSRLTNMVKLAIEEKFNETEKAYFVDWLKIIRLNK